MRRPSIHRIAAPSLSGFLQRVLLGAAVSFGGTDLPASGSELGVNSLLIRQYLDLPPPPPNDGYHRVRIAMARKAIADARDAGVRFFRVPVTGYWPLNAGDRSDLALWQNDPSAFWAKLDSMF